MEGTRSGRGWQTYNGDGSALTPMNASGQRIFQRSPIEPYNPGAEPSNEQAAIVLNEMGSWESYRVPGGPNVSDSYHRSDGMRSV